MNKRSWYLFSFFFLLLLGTAALSYHRIMVVHEYAVVEFQESIIDQLGL